MSHSLHTKAALLVIFLFTIHLPCAGAADLAACGVRLRAQQNTTQNATNTTEPPPVFTISYEQCLTECGSGLGDVNWQFFSQNFGAWFLPWISVMFQIPFGAERKFQIRVSLLRWILRKKQDPWMTLSLSSSPWVLQPLPPTPFRSRI